jgi:hypothetical protein
MAVTIADIHFSYHVYDRRADTLFLSVDGPRRTIPEEVFDTPEGHIVERQRRPTRRNRADGGP